MSDEADRLIEQELDYLAETKTISPYDVATNDLDILFSDSMCEMFGGQGEKND